MSTHRIALTQIVKRPSEPSPIVFVAHADRALRATLQMQIGDAGWQSQLFGDAETLLSKLHAVGPACLIVDVQLPDINGLELQSLLADHRDVPIIFIGDNPSARTIVRAMKAGAVEVLTAPLDNALLIDAIRQALQLSSTMLAQEADRRLLQQKYGRLSHREREVMRYVVRGHLNKNIAMDLGISEITVKVHRGQVMRKMQADSLADLVSMAMALPIDVPAQPDTPERSPLLLRSSLIAHDEKERIPCLTQ
jgi:FixJ family two-component response regulator